MAQVFDPLRSGLSSFPRCNPQTYWHETGGAAPADEGPLAEHIDTDIVVIGAGYTGLSCAYFLAQKYGRRVHVLEANQLGWGCSGRNGSFMRPAIGRLWWWQYVQKYGVEQAQVLFKHASAAIGTMRELLALAPFDCDKTSEGWLRVAHNAEAVQQLRRERETMARLFNYEVPLLDQAQLAAHGHGGCEAFGALHYPDGFAAHPLKVVYALAALAQSAGVKIHTRSPVIGMHMHQGKHRVQTPLAEVRAEHLVMATNGYSTEHLHPLIKSRLMPVLSSIVVTQPLSPEQRQQAAFNTTDIVTDTRRLLCFYRLLPDGRLLLGSRGAITENAKNNERVRTELLAAIGKKFPALKGVQADYFWSGWVALTMDSMPRIYSTTSAMAGEAASAGTISYAMGYNGSGTTAAVYCGRLLADHLGGGATITEVLAGQLPRMPLPALRRWAQRGAFLWYGWKDRR